ncbi:MAG: prephenate dehydrogenase/arogenate dehydrogenase family protein [Candidatus Hydrogenedentes bacterium]|nr:prephenate dehydrogenase/arogenate dehydrogenase family protein [Candidatus Hydrogenedentota bacterium]
MNRRYNIAVIMGVGLLGGSLGLALKARRIAGLVRGVGRRKESLDIAKSVGAIDEISLDLKAAAKDADLVVLCTPAALVTQALDDLRDTIPAAAIVTDVASTKAMICAHAEDTWPRPLRFVGSHPMAGSEKFGPEHSDVHLYDGSYTIMTPAQDQDATAYHAVKALWEAVGSKVVELPAALHDTLVARSSHLPHITAACLAELAAQFGDDIRPVIGNGFRDLTRIAAGRPEIWRDICLTNREAIVESLDAMGERLAAVREFIARNDAAGLERFFESGCEARRKALGK